MSESAEQKQEGYASLYYQICCFIDKKSGVPDDFLDDVKEDKNFLQEQEQLIHLSTKLRLRNVVCTHLEHELWLFARTEDSLNHILKDRDSLLKDVVRCE